MKAFSFLEEERKNENDMGMWIIITQNLSKV